MAWLNREYVPHISAFGFVILTADYELSRSSFSLYRKFTRDLVTKREGQSYETDAEFYDYDGSIHLQIEAKASASQTERLAAAIIQHGELDDLPVTAAKGVEYVLDLKPRYLWVVGPDAVDPALHVFAGVMLSTQPQMRRLRLALLSRRPSGRRTRWISALMKPRWKRYASTP